MKTCTAFLKLFYVWILRSAEGNNSVIPGRKGWVSGRWWRGFVLTCYGGKKQNWYEHVSSHRPQAPTTEASGRHGAVSWGVLASARAAGEKVSTVKTIEHLGGWLLNRVAHYHTHNVVMGHVHNVLLQATTFNWSAHVIQVPNPHRRHI